MSTLTMRSSPSHTTPSSSPYGRMLSTRSQSDILVPKPVKANLEFASPIKTHSSHVLGHELGSRPLSRSTSALTFDNYVLHPQPQTPIRSTSSIGHSNNNTGPMADGLSSSPERLAGIEIQNILFQRALLESSTFVAPKSPAPMFKLVPTTPTIKRNLNSCFESCKDQSESTNEQPQLPSAEEEEERPNLDRTTSYPSMTSSRDSTSFFQHVEEEDDDDDDSYSADDCVSSDEEEYYQDGYKLRMFGIYGSDDEEERCFTEDGIETFKSMTPPLRTENPLCFDDRFQHFSSTPVHERKRMDVGVELGLFKFSPIPSQN